MRLLQSREKPTRNALDQGGDVWLVPDSEAAETGTELSGTDLVAVIEPRMDLPDDHPLKGLRVLKHGYAGSSDLMIDDNGNITPISWFDGKIVGIEEPIHAK